MEVLGGEGWRKRWGGGEEMGRTEVKEWDLEGGRDPIFEGGDRGS